jgi:2-polyprenyl-3-methyl-5-hydroxy-6-metoxy-1,4-benzoquinol methylase
VLTTKVETEVGMLNTTSNGEYHAFVAECVLARCVPSGLRAADVGAGSGAIASRLNTWGCELLAVDQSAERFASQLSHLAVDITQADFTSKVAPVGLA